MVVNNGDFAKAGCGCNATYFDVLLCGSDEPQGKDRELSKLWAYETLTKGEQITQAGLKPLIF